jgi:hypothetical protein
MKLSKKYLLIAGLLILVLIYMFVSGSCSLTCSRKRDNFTEPKDACAYLAHDGYSKDFVGSCYDYMKICGNGSGASEAISMSEMYEIFDAKSGEAAYAAEVAKVSADKSQCMAPMPCGSMPDPAGQTYTYDEDSGQYVPNSSVIVQTPCPSFLGCSNLDSNGVGVCQ